MMLIALTHPLMTTLEGLAHVIISARSGLG